MLSCSCPEWDGEPGTWCYYIPDDFTKLKGKRRKRCCSCNKLIDIGSDCLEFTREKAANDEIEERIRGEVFSISSFWMCERCGEIYLNLNALGYCMVPTDEMTEALREYHEISGFQSLGSDGKEWKQK
jgi:hypothetical protein